MLLLQFPGPPILTVFSNSCTKKCIEYRIISIACKLLQSSSPCYLTISSQSSLLDPLDHPHWSLVFNHHLTPVSRSQTAHSGTPHLTCGTSFLLLFVFLINSIVHHHPALLHRHTLILDRLLTFLMAFSILVLKLPFSQSFPSIAVYPFFGLISWNYDQSLFGSHWRCSIRMCGRLGQPIWLLVRSVGLI